MQSLSLLQRRPDLTKVTNGKTMTCDWDADMDLDCKPYDQYRGSYTICYVDKAVYLQKTKKGRKGRVAVFKLWNKLARQRKLYITSGKVFRPYMY